MSFDTGSGDRGAFGGSTKSSKSQEDSLGPVSEEYAFNPQAENTTPIPILPAAEAPAPASQTKKESKKGGMSALREIIETLLLAFIIFVVVRAVVLNFRVDGTS